jgi:hypothetical protein
MNLPPSCMSSMMSACHDSFQLSELFQDQIRIGFV